MHQIIEMEMEMVMTVSITCSVPIIGIFNQLHRVHMNMKWMHIHV